MEDTLKGIVDYYTAALPTELTAIASERAVTIPAVAQIVKSAMHTHIYPSIEVLPGTLEYDYRDAQERLLAPIEYHGVTVKAWQVAPTQAMAQADVLRYAEAIRRVTTDDDTYGARFHDVRLVNAVFAEEPEPQESETYRQSVTVSLRVEVLPR